ncbi:MAG: hypothetical protein IJ859_03890 [Synergistaceae bacterium]|nr:hypothetical protein [Synergistaceae bacterium]
MTKDVRVKVRVRYEKDAKKFFDKHKDIQRQYEVSAEEFFTGEHPEKIDVKPIKGKQGEYYRMRLGKWRVIFTYDEELMVVIVNSIMAGSRGDVYKKIGGLKIL